jgi:hypothetical protein
MGVMMDKKLFDDAIGELPPSTVDVEAAIGRGRRAARFWPVNNPVVAVIGGVLVLTMGTAMALRPGEPGGEPLAGPESVTTPRPVPDAGDICPLATAAPADPTVVARADRLTVALLAAVERQLPPDTSLVSTVADGKRPADFLVEVPSRDHPSCEIDPDAMHARAGITWMGNSNTTLDVSVTSGEFTEHGSMESWCARLAGAPYFPECERRTTSGGDAVLEVVAERNDIVVANGVEVVRADGTAVSVIVDGGMLSDYAVGGTYTPPLSVDQLVEIALDPALTLNP